MQLNKLSPIAGLILATMLGACGGGGGDDPAPAPTPAPPAIKVSSVSLSSTTPRAIAEAALQFNGGACSGGTGTLTPSWNFGDGLSDNPHTYATDGVKTITVTCTDSAGTAAKTTTLNLTVASAAMNGFLGRTWSTYSSIDSTNVSPYPVAGIADSGDIYGVWLRRVASNMEVAAGTTNFSSNSWTVSGTLATGADRSAFDDTAAGKQTAMIDLAVSPNGHAIAAWVAGSSIWYATKNSLSDAWSIPSKIAGETVIDASIKVVVNDSGNGAIGYCNSATDARVITFSPTSIPAIQPSVTISKQCGVMDTTFAFQRHRAFDISINPFSTILVAGIANGVTSGSSVVVIKDKHLGAGWSTLVAISSELATAPESLSLSLSPSGNRAGIAWNQVSLTSPFKSNVYTSIFNGTIWGTPTPVQNDFTTKDYARPLIAVNDHGDAFLAMRLIDPNSNITTEVSNYNAAATSPAWSWPKQISTTGLYTTDIAIDNWGTGLVTASDSNSWYTQAGTFAKATGTSQWSGFTTISPIASYYPAYYPYQTFHYQTMRALPDGRAILVTSMYDDKTAVIGIKTPIASGYMLLK